MMDVDLEARTSMERLGPRVSILTQKGRPYPLPRWPAAERRQSCISISSAWRVIRGKASGVADWASAVSERCVKATRHEKQDDEHENPQTQADEWQRRVHRPQRCVRRRRGTMASTRADWPGCRTHRTPLRPSSPWPGGKCRGHVRRQPYMLRCAHMATRVHGDAGWVGC